MAPICALCYCGAIPSLFRAKSPGSTLGVHLWVNLPPHILKKYQPVLWFFTTVYLTFHFLCFVLHLRLVERINYIPCRSTWAWSCKLYGTLLLRGFLILYVDLGCWSAAGHCSDVAHIADEFQVPVSLRSTGSALDGEDNSWLDVFIELIFFHPVCRGTNSILLLSSSAASSSLSSAYL